MKSEVLKNFPLPWLTVVGLLLFASVFVGILIWTRRPGSTALYRRMASLPLIESDSQENQS